MSGVFRLSSDAAAVAQYTGPPLKDKDFAFALQMISFARDAPALLIGCPSAAVRDTWLGEIQTLFRAAFEQQRDRTARQYVVVVVVVVVGLIDV